MNEMPMANYQEVMDGMHSGKIKLLRHFKGAYYYVNNLSKFEVSHVKNISMSGVVMVNYSNVCHPEYGTFTRPLYEFFETFDAMKNEKIVDRKDNVTGQTTRFAVVTDLDFQIKDIDTDTLVNELLSRPDSPLLEQDFKETSDKIYIRDYVTAYEMGFNNSLTSMVGHETEERANKYLEGHMSSTGKFPSLFKRIFIKIK